MRKKLEFLEHLEEYLMDALLVIMFVTVLAQIFSRYILGKPLLFTEELSLLCFLWIVMLGVGFCFQHDLNTKVTLIVDLFPKTVVNIINIVINTVCAIFMILLFLPAFRFTVTQNAVSSAVLPIQMSVKYASFVIGCVLIVIRSTEASIRLFLDIRKEENK